MTLLLLFLLTVILMLTRPSILAQKDPRKVGLVMSVIFVLQQHGVLVLDGRDLATGVVPDLGTAHVDSDDEQQEGHLGPRVQRADLTVLRSDEAEDDRG